MPCLGLIFTKFGLEAAIRHGMMFRCKHVALEKVNLSKLHSNKTICRGIEWRYWCKCLHLPFKSNPKALSKSPKKILFKICTCFIDPEVNWLWANWHLKGSGGQLSQKGLWSQSAHIFKIKTVTLKKKDKMNEGSELNTLNDCKWMHHKKEISWIGTIYWIWR